MFKTHVSGSESIVGSMNFLQNGDISLDLSSKDDSVSTYDKSMLLLTTEFLVYALERDDWMSEFLLLTNKNLKELMANLPKHKARGHGLRVIEGGLSSKADIEKDAKSSQTEISAEYHTENAVTYTHLTLPTILHE